MLLLWEVGELWDTRHDTTSGHWGWDLQVVPALSLSPSPSLLPDASTTDSLAEHHAFCAVTDSASDSGSEVNLYGFCWSFVRDGDNDTAAAAVTMRHYTH